MRVSIILISFLFILSVVCQAVVIETVPVGDVGNQPDTEVMSDGTTGYGSVGYVYRMGKYEVTAGQYTEFLNAVAATDTYGLYHDGMWSHSYGCKIQRSSPTGSYTYNVAAAWANRPVNSVNYWSACRFANWLHNGQPTGAQGPSTTERGAYILDGYDSWEGGSIHRNSEAKWFLPSEDEWYKAAYYDPKKPGGAGYWDYPTRSNVLPSNVLGDPIDPGNNATYLTSVFTIGSPYYRTEIGAHENSESAYGTYDQAGNVAEWNEAIVKEETGYSWRGMRGGGFDRFDTSLPALHRSLSISWNSYYWAGFRVAEAVPEPSSILAIAAGFGLIMGLKRRRV